MPLRSWIGLALLAALAVRPPGAAAQGPVVGAGGWVPEANGAPVAASGGSQSDPWRPGRSELRLGPAPDDAAPLAVFAPAQAEPPGVFPRAFIGSLGGLLAGAVVGGGVASATGGERSDGFEGLGFVLVGAAAGSVAGAATGAWWARRESAAPLSAGKALLGAALGLPVGFVAGAALAQGTVGGFYVVGHSLGQALITALVAGTE